MSMTIVRVKHKHQVTIPASLREKLNIDEGTKLDAVEHDEGILLKTIHPPQPGEPVGREKYESILAELEETRRRRR